MITDFIASSYIQIQPSHFLLFLLHPSLHPLELRGLGLSLKEPLLGLLKVDHVPDGIEVLHQLSTFAYEA